MRKHPRSLDFKYGVLSRGSSHLVLPASAFIISVLYGQSDHRAIYLLTLFFGMMELLGCYLSFIHVSLTDIEKILAPSSEIALYGVLPSLLGVMIGQYINKQNRYKMEPLIFKGGQ